MGWAVGLGEVLPDPAGDADAARVAAEALQARPVAGGVAGVVVLRDGREHDLRLGSDVVQTHDVTEFVQQQIAPGGARTEARLELRVLRRVQDHEAAAGRALPRVAADFPELVRVAAAARGPARAGAAEQV